MSSKKSKAWKCSKNFKIDNFPCFFLYTISLNEFSMEVYYLYVFLLWFYMSNQSSKQLHQLRLCIQMCLEGKIGTNHRIQVLKFHCYAQMSPFWIISQYYQLISNLINLVNISVIIKIFYYSMVIKKLTFLEFHSYNQKI